MNSAHSLSAFRGSCVVQPRHPKTKLPTTAVERQSFDFSTVNRQTSFSSETSGHSSTEGGRERTNEPLNVEEEGNSRSQRKARKRNIPLKQKNLSKSSSKSASIHRQPRLVNNSEVHSQMLIDMKALSLDDDLFFRNLQALKEENKRALRTLERLYKFGQEEEVQLQHNKFGQEEVQLQHNKNEGNHKSGKRKSSEEHISEDSGVSRSSRENGHNTVTSHDNDDDDDDDDENGEDEKENIRETYNSSNLEGSGDNMPAESIEGNIVYRLNGDPLLHGFSQNGVGVENGKHLSSSLDHGYVDGGQHSDSSGENGYAQHARFVNSAMGNGYAENGYEKRYPETGVHGMKRYGDRDGRRASVEIGRRRSFNVGSNMAHYPVRYDGFAHHGHRDYVADMDKRAKTERERTRERRRESESSEEDEVSPKLHVNIPTSHVNILPENNASFRGRQSNYDVIRNMWNNFSVDDTVPPYIHRNEEGRRGIRKKRQGWSPTVTVQEPFKMTVREEKNRDLKQKKIERIKDELLKKKLEEEAELKKRAVPTPVPPSTFLPMYTEQQQHQQQKKQYMKEISKHILKSTEKPFSFVQREETKRKLQRSQSMYTKRTENTNKPTVVDRRRASFKANPIPDHLFDLTWKDKQAEQEEYRKIKRKLRSQELLASSSLPPSMKTRGDLDKYRKSKDTTNKSSNKNNKDNGKNRPFQPQVHHNIPDFEEMQKKIEMALEVRKQQNTPTTPQPFDLHTARVGTRRSKFINESLRSKVHSSPPTGSSPMRPNATIARRNTITGRDLQYRRGSNSNSNGGPPSSNGVRSRSGSLQSGSLLSRSRSCSPVYNVTEAHRRRQEYIRQAAEKEKQERARLVEEKKVKQKEISKLQKVVAQKSAAHDPSRFREKEAAQKLASFKQAEKERHREYKAFLRSVEQKNEQRPLLFERESQTNAKRKAQRRYEEILRRAGIDGKTLEAFLVGDKNLQRRLDRVINSDNDEDIPLKSEPGYDVVMKSNSNSSRSCENIEDDDEDDDDEEEEDEDDEDEEDDDEDDEEDEDDDNDDDDDDEEDSDDDDNLDNTVDNEDDDDDDADDDDDGDDDKNEMNGNHDGDVDSDDGSYKPS